MKNAWYVIVLVLVGAGCDEFGHTPQPEIPMIKQSEIWEIRIEPHPVVVGDTARITCVIRDSLDTRFQYSWFILGGNRLTRENYIDWVAPDSAGTYLQIVRVDNGSQDSLAIQGNFRVQVVEPSSE